MNKKQLIIMWVGIAAILIGSMFPYWYMSGAARTRGGNHGYIRPLGRHFIFTPPSLIGYLSDSAVWIDLAPLHIEWTVISVVTIGLFVAFRGKEK